MAESLGLAAIAAAACALRLRGVCGVPDDCASRPPPPLPPDPALDPDPARGECEAATGESYSGGSSSISTESTTPDRSRLSSATGRAALPPFLPPPRSNAASEARADLPRAPPAGESCAMMGAATPPRGLIERCCAPALAPGGPLAAVGPPRAPAPSPPFGESGDLRSALLPLRVTAGDCWCLSAAPASAEFRRCLAPAPGVCPLRGLPFVRELAIICSLWGNRVKSFP